MPRTLVIERIAEQGQPQTLLGHAVKYDDGRWKFFPAINGRRPSKRYHKSLKSCLPFWVQYPNHTKSRWDNVPILISSMVNPDWNLAAHVYHWPEEDRFEVRLQPIWATGHEKIEQPPSFRRYHEAMDWARDRLAL